MMVTMNLKTAVGLLLKNSLLILVLSVGIAAGQTPSPTVTIPRETLNKAKAAADEVVVSRDLIKSLERENSLLRENKLLLEQKVGLLETINDIQSKQLVEKDKYSNALLQERDLLQNKVAKLERSNRRWKKFGKIMLGTAVILGGVVLH